jgi:hypothetical protein
LKAATSCAKGTLFQVDHGKLLEDGAIGQRRAATNGATFLGWSNQRAPIEPTTTRAVSPFAAVFARDRCGATLTSI